MAETQTTKLPTISARPEMTQTIMDKTGLDQVMISALVHQFYGKIRADTVLVPIFASQIGDWATHLERMVSFWSSVALMTGTYHGAPMRAQSCGIFVGRSGAFRRRERACGLSNVLTHMIGEMEVHMKKEELILFPAIRRGGMPGIEQPITVMRANHDDHTAEIAEIRRLTGGPTLTKGACGTWTALYTRLHAFLTDLEEHMRLENDVLLRQFEPQ